jgi:hypothetical protein
MKIDKETRRIVNGNLLALRKETKEGVPPFKEVERIFDDLDLAIMDGRDERIQTALFSMQGGSMTCKIRGQRGEITNASLHITWGQGTFQKLDRLYFG